MSKFNCIGDSTPGKCHACRSAMPSQPIRMFSGFGGEQHCGCRSHTYLALPHKIAVQHEVLPHYSHMSYATSEQSTSMADTARRQLTKSGAA